jgi:N4-gp56 family major capsid protein
MANTITIDALRQELWSKDLLDDVMRDVENVMQFMGPDANNIVQVSRELAKQKGDVETFGLVARLSGSGVTGDDELEGNEESMSSYSEQVAIDQIRNAVRLKGKLDAQKVVYDQIKVARENLRVWMKEFLARQIFLKAGGVTNTSLTDTNGVTVGARAAWSNTPDFIPDADEAAGSGNRYLCKNTGGTDAIGAGDTMSLDFVTKLATKATLSDPKIQKIERNGESFYVLYLHPLQARDIRISSDWKTAQQNARERSEKNPVFKGALGYWSGVLLLENEFVPWLDATGGSGMHSFRGVATGTDCAVNIARSLLCGRQAVLMAEASNPEALVVEQFDYKNKDGVAGSFIGGLQKAMFNSKEYGVIAGDTAAAV